VRWEANLSERPVAIGLFREAVVRFSEGKTTTASRLADRARELFLAAGDIDGACAAALLRGRAALRASRYSEATEWFLWARNEANRRGLEPRVLAATSELAVLAELQGDGLGAVAAHRGVLEQQRTRDDNLGIAMAAGNVARLLPRVAGHTPEIILEARELLTEALQRFRDGPHEAGIANTLICFGDLERAEGKLDEAQRLFHEVVDLVPSPAVQPMRLLAMHNLGNVMRQVGDYTRALESYRAALALAETLGDVRSARRAAVSVAMSHAMTAPVTQSVVALERVSAGLAGTEDRAAEAIVSVNQAQLLAASGEMNAALARFEVAHRYYTQKSDRPLVDELDLAVASVSFSASSDRRAQKLIRRAAPGEWASPALAREALLLRAQVAFRRMDLVDFDAAVAALGDARSWQETVGVAALCVERAAFGGVDTGPALEPMLQRALDSGARVDAVALRLAQANAALWLGDTARAEAIATAVQREATTLGRVLLALRARMVRGLARGGPMDARKWQAESDRLRAAGAAVPAGWAGAAAALGTRDDVAFQRHLDAVREAGDERQRLFLLVWRATLGPPTVAGHAVATLEQAGLAVPPWLRKAAVGEF
jgi:tetratricopeptide (TPR) repeat protein